MGKRSSFKRPQATRIIGRKVIIVCEGKKTEYGYFEAIRKHLRLPTLQVRVIHPDATDPLSIVRYALDIRQDLKVEKAWASEDSVWAVFDGDEHRLENPDNWNNAIQTARSKKVELAVSNPCFELWYLLHYQDRAASLSRQEAERLLRKHISGYKKNGILWPVPLELLTPEAMRRAKKIAERAIADAYPEHTNPCTSVCNLVESLLELGKEISR